MKKLLPIYRKMENKESIRNTYLGLARAYLALGDTDKAAQYTQKAEEISPENGE